MEEEVNQRVRLHFPMQLDGDSRFATTGADFDAVIQCFNIVQDLSPDEFPTIPALASPCADVGSEWLDSTEIRLEGLCESIESMFTGLGRCDLKVTPEIGPEVEDSEDTAVIIESKAWRMRIPVQFRGENVLLVSQATEIPRGE